MALKNKKNPFKKYYKVTAVANELYDDHPFFVKKKNDAMAFLRKHGFPRNLTKEQLGFEQVWNEERKEWDFVKGEVKLF